MQQKIIQIGNSAGIVIPQHFREEIGLKVGDNVVVEKKGNQLTVSLPAKKSTGGVDAKFMQMVDEFIEEHKDVLEELSHR